jgi:hypothetical protein
MPQWNALKPVLKQLFARFKDRGYKMKENDDIGNLMTKKEMQEEVNELYTGSEMLSDTMYSMNYTYFWAVLFYSTGCPILYPLACVFYFVQYWYQKTLSLKYYRRSSKFSHHLPIESTSYLRVAVFMHAVMAYMMLSDDGLLPGSEIQTFIEINEKTLGDG